MACNLTHVEIGKCESELRSLNDRFRMTYYIGSGLSVAAGLVTWKTMADIVDRHISAKERGVSRLPRSSSDARVLSTYLQHFVEERDNRGHRILSRDCTDPRAFPRTALLNFLFRCRHDPTKAAPSDSGDDPTLKFHTAVWKTGPFAVLTTNYDMLLDYAYVEANLNRDQLRIFRSYQYTAEFLPFILTNKCFVLKLHGDINDIGTMQLDSFGAWDSGGVFDGRCGADLRRVYCRLASSGHMIYLGCGMRDRTIWELHRYWRENRCMLGFRRFALIPECELQSICNEVPNAERLYSDVTFVTYPTGSAGGKPTFHPKHIEDFVAMIGRNRTEGATLQDATKDVGCACRLGWPYCERADGKTTYYESFHGMPSR